jgi:hypothetical protein
LGFVLRHDFTQAQLQLQYRGFASPSSALRTATLESQSSLYLRNGDRTVESAQFARSIRFEMKSGRRLSLTVENNYESVLERFHLSGVTPVEPGDYWFHEGELEFNLSRSALIRGSASARAGTFYDGWRAAFSGGPTVSFSRHLEIGSNYLVNLVRFPDRNESLTSHLAQLRLQLAFNIHLSAAGLFQYSSTADRLAVNARLRYHIKEGSDLWLVYNDDLNTERFVAGGPRLPLSQARTAMLKFTYTFVQ